MQSVFDAEVRDELRRRMASIDPTRAPLWGKMTAPRMLAHLNASLAMALGDLPTKRKKSPLNNPLARWLVIYLLPWPQGTPTAPELLIDDPADWQGELARFGEQLERMAGFRDATTWPLHPVFGRMNARYWGNLSWKHTDHHLRQFGA